MNLQLVQTTLGRSGDATLLAAEGWRWLLDHGFGEPQLTLYPTYEAILARGTENGRDYQILGVLVFFHDVGMAKTWIQMSYVREEFRGRGVYRAMYSAARKIAIDEGSVSIAGATHVNNTAMRSAAKRMGRREVAVSLEEQFDVELKDVTSSLSP